MVMMVVLAYRRELKILHKDPGRRVYKRFGLHPGQEGKVCQKLLLVSAS